MEDSESILEQRMNLKELSQILNSLCTHKEVTKKPEIDNQNENVPVEKATKNESVDESIFKIEKIFYT